MLSSELYGENPILMIRDISLCAQQNSLLPFNARVSIEKNYKQIRLVPRKLIKPELDRLIMSVSASDGFRLLSDLGILKIILPCVDRCFSEPQKNKYHIFNVGEHILHALDNCPFCLETRWAALMHDVGKPNCSSRDSSGIIHFYGHHMESVKLAEDVFYKFGFLDEERKLICSLIEYHDVHFEQTTVGVKRALSKLGEKKFLMLMDLQEADARAKNPIYISEKCAIINNLRKLCAEVVTRGEPYKYTDLAIGKRDLMKLKYRAERQIHDVLRILFDEVIINPSLNNREYLLNRAKILKNKH